MSKKKSKKYVKKKDEPNQPGPAFNTPSRFIGNTFSKGKPPVQRKGFNPGQFKVQHKG